MIPAAQGGQIFPRIDDEGNGLGAGADEPMGRCGPPRCPCAGAGQSQGFELSSPQSLQGEGFRTGVLCAAQEAAIATGLVKIVRYFLEEHPESGRRALEVMRQPKEDEFVRTRRAKVSLTMEQAIAFALQEVHD